jgi:hypothetical protein
MPTNQLAPPDMPWLTGNMAGPPNGLGPPLLNYAAPPPDATQGAGVAAAGQQAWQWLQDQRAESVRQGLLDPNTGLPTQAGVVDAAQQYAGGLLAGSTTPGEPGMTAAIRLNGKVYRAPDDNPTHFGALAQGPPDQRAAAMGDGANRVYVTDQGKVLDRYKAADYARSFGIYDQGVPSYAATSPEYIAEWLPGYKAMLQRVKDSLN